MKQSKLEELEKKLILIAAEQMSKEDVSHDVNHALRVLDNVKKLAAAEGGDLEILIPAALLHDAIVLPKNHPESKTSAQKSALFAEKVLLSVTGYPKDKIKLVMICIAEHSYELKVTPELLESKILQDADRLEATGAILLMRVFSSTGQMKRKFYNSTDPFFKTKRELKPLEYALDSFYSRWLHVPEKMNTPAGKKLAEERNKFVENFLKQLETEI